MARWTAAGSLRCLAAMVEHPTPLRWRNRSLPSLFFFFFFFITGGTRCENSFGKDLGVLLLKGQDIGGKNEKQTLCSPARRVCLEAERRVILALDYNVFTSQSESSRLL